MNGGKCIAKDGFFDNGKDPKAEKCNFSCATCKNKDTCEEAGPGREIGENGLAQCVAGTFETNKAECGKCHASCATCFGAGKN